MLALLWLVFACCMATSRLEKRAARAHDRGYLQPVPKDHAHMLVHRRFLSRMRAQYDALMLHEKLNHVTGQPHHFLGTAIQHAAPILGNDCTKSARHTNKRAAECRHQWPDEDPNQAKHGWPTDAPSSSITENLGSKHVICLDELVKRDNSSGCRETSENEAELHATSILLYAHSFDPFVVHEHGFCKGHGKEFTYSPHYFDNGGIVLGSSGEEPWSSDGSAWMKDCLQDENSSEDFQGRSPHDGKVHGNLDFSDYDEITNGSHEATEAFFTDKPAEKLGAVQWVDVVDSSEEDECSKDRRFCHHGGGSAKEHFDEQDLHGDFNDELVEKIWTQDGLHDLPDGEQKSDSGSKDTARLGSLHELHEKRVLHGSADLHDTEKKSDSGSQDTVRLGSPRELQEKKVLHGSADLHDAVKESDSGYKDNARLGSLHELQEKKALHEKDDTLHGNFVISDFEANANRSHTEDVKVWQHRNLEAVIQAPWRKRTSYDIDPTEAADGYDHTLREATIIFDLAAGDDASFNGRYVEPPGFSDFSTKPGFGIRNLVLNGQALHVDENSAHDDGNLDDRKTSKFPIITNLHEKLHDDDDDLPNYPLQALAEDSVHDDGNLDDRKTSKFHIITNLYEHVHDEGDLHDSPEKLLGLQALAEDPVQEEDDMHVHGEQGFVYMMRSACPDRLVECISMDTLQLFANTAVSRASDAALKNCLELQLRRTRAQYETQLDAWADAHRQWMEAAYDTKSLYVRCQQQIYRILDLQCPLADDDKPFFGLPFPIRRLEEWKRQIDGIGDRYQSLQDTVANLKTVNAKLMQELAGLKRNDYFQKLHMSLNAVGFQKAWLTSASDALEKHDGASEPINENDPEHLTFKPGKFCKNENSENSGKTETETKKKRRPKASRSKHPAPIGPSNERTGPMGPNQEQKERTETSHTTPGCAENPSCAPLLGNSGQSNFFEPCTTAGNSAAMNLNALAHHDTDI